MENLHFQHIDRLDEALQEAINVELRRYNREHNPAFYAARELPANLARPLNVVAFDADNTVVAGLVAETQLAWLKISIVSVRADSRRRGIGTRLMAMAEEEAIARGCKYSFLDTMDYQAPSFYRKLGYQVCGHIDDWDSHGHAKFLMTRYLVTRSSE